MRGLNFSALGFPRYPPGDLGTLGGMLKVWPVVVGD